MGINQVETRCHCHHLHHRSGGRTNPYLFWEITHDTPQGKEPVSPTDRDTPGLDPPTRAGAGSPALEGIPDRPDADNVRLPMVSRAHLRHIHPEIECNVEADYADMASSLDRPAVVISAGDTDWFFPVDDLWPQLPAS